MILRNVMLNKEAYYQREHSPWFYLKLEIRQNLTVMENRTVLTLRKEFWLGKDARRASQLLGMVYLFLHVYFVKINWAEYLWSLYINVCMLHLNKKFALKIHVF